MAQQRLDVLSYIVIARAFAEGGGIALVMGEGDTAGVFHRFSMARMLASASLPRAALISCGASSWPSQTRSSLGSSSRKRLGRQSMISPYCLRLAAKVMVRLRLARVMPT